jgi:hypothetical protein
MKYLGIMSWKPEDAEKVTDLFLKWKKPEGLRWVYGPCTMIGHNKSVSIFEGPDEAIAKIDRYWRNTCTSEIYPIMESAEIAKIKA